MLADAAQWVIALAGVLPLVLIVGVLLFRRRGRGGSDHDDPGGSSE
jgi:hypothetical protein